jgi:hypothetical protein
MNPLGAGDRETFRAPAALRQWRHVVPFNESSYEQTPVMREALEMVVHLTHDGERRRDEIANIIVRIASEIRFDATELANVTLSAMAESARKKD